MWEWALVTAALTLAACRQERAARVEPIPATVLDAGVRRGAATPPAIGKGVWIYVELAVYHSTPGAVEKAKALLASEHSVLRFAEKPSRDSPTPAVFIREPVLETYRPPDQSQLKLFGRGFGPDDANRIGTSKHVTVVGVTAHRGDEGNAALRAAHVLALDLARAVSGYIWDEGTREAFTPEAFEKRRLAVWSGGLPRAASQYVIHAYRERELLRLITLGMDKLGLPDLVVEDAADGLSSRLGKVITLVAQTLAEGGTADASGYLSLDIEGVRDADERASLLREVVANGKKRAQVRLVEGHHEKGDSDNELRELDFGESPERQVRQAALIAALFGIEDKISRVQGGDVEIAAARARAKKRLLAEVKPLFLKGLPFDEHLSVKAPFVEGEQTEWMWLQVVRWEGHQIRGILNNQPYYLHSVRQGAQVSVDEASVFDYELHLPDGGTEGNETQALIEAAAVK